MAEGKLPIGQGAPQGCPLPTEDSIVICELISVMPYVGAMLIPRSIAFSSRSC
jgi:hypothetical protein